MVINTPVGLTHSNQYGSSLCGVRPGEWKDRIRI